MKLMLQFIVLIALLPSYFLSAKQPLSIAFVEYPPFHATKENRVDGISIRIVEEVFKRIDTPIKFQSIPWSRALLWLKSGKIDAMVGVFMNSDRQSYIDFSGVPLSEAPIHLFVTEESNIEYSGDLHNLSHLHFGIKQDFSYGPKFDNLVAQKKLSKVSKEVDSIKLLLKLCSGVIDIMVGEKFNTEYLFNKLNNNSSPQLKRCKKIVELSPAIDSRSAYMAFSKQRQLTDIRDKFDETMRKMKQDGSFDRIAQSYQTTTFND